MDGSPNLLVSAVSVVRQALLVLFMGTLLVPPAQGQVTSRPRSVWYYSQDGQLQVIPPNRTFDRDRAGHQYSSIDPRFHPDPYRWYWREPVATGVLVPGAMIGGFSPGSWAFLPDQPALTRGSIPEVVAPGTARPYTVARPIQPTRPAPAISNRAILVPDYPNLPPNGPAPAP